MHEEVLWMTALDDPAWIWVFKIPQCSRKDCTNSDIAESAIMFTQSCWGEELMGYVGLETEIIHRMQKAITHNDCLQLLYVIPESERRSTVSNCLGASQELCMGWLIQTRLFRTGPACAKHIRLGSKCIFIGSRPGLMVKQ